jgi:ABC-2 type transport system permease protein
MDSMPTGFWYAAHLMPTTWLIDGVRGVLLRGAGLDALWSHTITLWGMAVTMFAVNVRNGAKQLT